MAYLLSGRGVDAAAGRDLQGTESKDWLGNSRILELQAVGMRLGVQRTVEVDLEATLHKLSMVTCQK